MEWFGFWIFAAVCVAVDAWLYSKGHAGFIFKAKTHAELSIRDREAYGKATAAPQDPRQVRSATIEPDQPWPRA